MIKIAAKFLLPGFEKHILSEYEGAWGPAYVPIHSRVFEKIATSVFIPERLIKAAASLTARDDGRYVHINAVGADKFWSCCFPGTLVLTEAGRYLPIEQVKIGDRVLNHTGAFRDVLTTWKYPAHGYGVQIRVRGLMDPICVTDQHRFFVVQKDSVQCGRDSHKRCLPEVQGTQNICRRPQSIACRTAPKVIQMVLKRADDLGVKDYLVCPLPEHDAAPIFDEETAWIAGLWVAEGSRVIVDGYRVGVELSVGSHEVETIHRVLAYARSHGIRINGPCACSDSGATSIRLLDSEVVNTLVDLFGHGAANKVIPGNFANQPESVILSFLAGYFDGDGSGHRDSNRAYAASISKDLVLGVQRLLWSVRIPATVNPAPKDQFHVNFSMQRGEKLCNLIPRFRRRDPGGRSHYQQWFFDNYVALPITELRRVRLPEFVYDLEVEEEHTYNVGQVACHNSNKNGDSFPKWSLKGEPPPPDEMSFLQARGLVVPPEYGYETFEKYAYPYLLHNNSDPALSIGERVVCAAYNEPMERVEIIVFISKTKAPDLVDKIDRGEPIPWSMGCRVPWDRCSLCMNTAKNREQYCNHLKTLMNVTLPDGRKVMAENLFPRFFDISHVIVPAWAPAYSLRKVAGLGQSADPTAAKRAFAYGPNPVNFEKIAMAQSELRKKAVLKEGAIVKTVPAEPGQNNLGSKLLTPKNVETLRNLIKRDEATTPMILGAHLRRLRDEIGLRKLLNGATASGIMFRPAEIDALTGGDASQLPSSLDLDSVPSKILSLFRGLVPDRSMFDPPFANRVVRVIKITTIPGPISKGASEAYDRYMGLLGNLEVPELLRAANRPELMLVRDPFGLDLPLAGIKLASDELRSILPFLTGIKTIVRK